MKKIWTTEEDEYLRKNYPDISSKEISAHLNRSISSIYGRVFFLKIKKTDDYLKKYVHIIKFETGINHRYAKGNVPANKGKKMNAEQYEKCKNYMFKKGNIPTNTKYDGYITERKDKNGRSYLYIRISKCAYMLLHRNIWEKHNGPVPQGYNIVFKNGNSNDVRIENLEMITDAELMQHNTIHNYPEEIKQLIIVKNMLNKQLNKSKNE